VSYSLKYHKRVYKFLEKCEFHIAQKFTDATKILAKDPYSTKLDTKSLQWKEKGNYRLRIGKYRFKYTIINQEIIIYFYEADSRGDIYK